MRLTSRTSEGDEMRVMLLGVLFAFGCGVVTQPRHVECYPVQSNGWNFDCEVTGRGEEKAQNQFSSQFINVIAQQGNDLNRSFQGERWHALVRVERAGSSARVEPGREYKMYGTVQNISGNRVQFTDCVFAPVPKEEK